MSRRGGMSKETFRSQVMPTLQALWPKAFGATAEVAERDERTRMLAEELMPLDAEQANALLRDIRKSDDKSQFAPRISLVTSRARAIVRAEKVASYQAAASTKPETPDTVESVMREYEQYRVRAEAIGGRAGFVYVLDCARRLRDCGLSWDDAEAMTQRVFPLHEPRPQPEWWEASRDELLAMFSTRGRMLAQQMTTRKAKVTGGAA